MPPLLITSCKMYLQGKGYNLQHRFNLFQDAIDIWFTFHVIPTKGIVASLKILPGNEAVTVYVFHAAAATGSMTPAIWRILGSTQT